MKKKDATLVLVVVTLVAAAAAGGYLYRRYKHPTLEERMEDASGDLKSAFEKMTR